jgi:peptidoglycan/LPS O-acetylase OafA/YrhL
MRAVPQQMPHGGQPRSSFSPAAVVCTCAALALVCRCISLALPPATSLSAYITLHFAAQSLLRAVARLRNPQRYDPSDHTLHLVSALAGVAYACCAAPLPDNPQLLPLALLCLLLLLRVLLHQFPF